MHTYSFAKIDRENAARRKEPQVTVYTVCHCCGRDMGNKQVCLDYYLDKLMKDEWGKAICEPCRIDLWEKHGLSRHQRSGEL